MPHLKPLPCINTQNSQLYETFQQLHCFKQAKDNSIRDNLTTKRIIDFTGMETRRNVFGIPVMAKIF